MLSLLLIQQLDSLKYFFIYNIYIQYMANLHDKMQTDYEWIRAHNPNDINARQRTHGYSYLYTNVPNKFERIQMIYRSIGKQYDWQLQKFRLAKKGIDKGNKKRFIKNVLRMIKNPLGYFHWKTFNFRSSSMRAITFGLIAAVITSIFKYRQASFAVSRANAKLLGYGKNVEGQIGNYLGYYDRRPFREYANISALLYVDIKPRWVIINQTWKQNLRKEFQLLKYNNVDY